MIDEFKAFFVAFQKGKQLASSATWKNRTIATNALVAFLGAVLLIAKGFGYDIHLDQDTLAALAGGIAAIVPVFNAIMHVITSAKVGLPTMGQSGYNNPATSGPSTGGEPGP